MQKKNFIGFRDRILLHLLRFEKEVYDNIHGDEVDGSYREFLINLTQEGIADSVGTKQSTIYKELQTLRTSAIEGEEPLIRILDRIRIPGKERSCSIYFLSPYGHDLAEQKKNYIEDKNLEILDLEDPEEKVISIKNLTQRLIDEDYESNYIGAILKVASTVSYEGNIQWSELIKPPVTTAQVRTGKPEGLVGQKIKRKPIEIVENPYFNRIAIRDPEYFFGRTDEVQLITSLLRNCQSCSIVGARRSGKSSLINYISHESVLKKHGLNNEDFIFVPIDLEGLAEISQSEFFTMIIEEIRNRTNNNELRGKIEGLLAKDEVRFLDVKNIMRDITGLDKNVIFLLDEFELITNNKNLDCNFYSGLRNLANSYNVAYITSSNVPLLDLTLSQKTLGSPFFNFFSLLELGLVDKTGVQDLIYIPSRKYGVEFPENVVQFIKDTAGPHAFFIQILCFHIFQWIKENGSISETDLLKIKNMFISEAKPHYQYFWNHLSEDEQQVLSTLSLEKNYDISRMNQGHIKDLIKKSLLVSDDKRHTIFSKGFSEFVYGISVVPIKSTFSRVSIEPIEPIEPIKPDISDGSNLAEPQMSMERGNNYFIDEYEPKISIRIFKKILDQGASGLFITRTEPQQAEQKWGLKNSRIIWLCSRSGPGCLPPALEKISHTIIEFISKNENSAVFLDGIEFIVNNNDFLRTLSLMDNLKENMAINKSILIYPISSSIFSEREMALLGKNSVKIDKDFDIAL
jgi:hypothetical protein